MIVPRPPPFPAAPVMFRTLAPRPAVTRRRGGKKGKRKDGKPVKKRPPAPIYGPEQHEALARAGRFNADLMDVLRPHVVPGTTTGELDEIAHAYTRDHGHRPATLGYENAHGGRDYPASICTSVNEVVCHGIPGDYALRDGDIVNVDLTTIVDGWHGDSSETFLCGDVDAKTVELVQATFDGLWAGIRAAKPWGTVFDIGRAIFGLARDRGFGVVRNFQGHGLGEAFHQEPGIPHYPEDAAKKVVLKPGMCFTIEPMLNAGTQDTAKPDRRDGWSVRTKDRKPSAQFEHTLFMTHDGVDVLTLAPHGPAEGHRFGPPRETS